MLGLISTAIYVIQTVKRGVMRGAKYIVKMNDHQCLNPEELEKLIKEVEEPEYGYFGKTERTTKVPWP